MTLWQLMLLVVAMGAAGGLVNCAIAGEFMLPKTHDGVWRPGWIGNVLVGAVAAFVVTGTNGQFSNLVLQGTSEPALTATWSQIAGALVVGLGGGNILTNLAARKADQVTKSKLSDVVKTAMQRRNP